MGAISRAAQRVPIVLAANMSLGVNLLEQVVEEVARILDTDWDIEVVEMHHRHKVDAPSGTALSLGEVRGARGAACSCGGWRGAAATGRSGPRVRGEIGFSAIRGGDVVGDHTVIFAADGERIEITHKALQPRDLRARRGEGGALGGRQARRPLQHEGRARLQPGLPCAGRRRLAATIRGSANPSRMSTSATRALRCGCSPKRK